MFKLYFKHLIPFMRISFPIAVIMIPIGLFYVNLSDWLPGENALNENGTKSLIMTGYSGGVKRFKDGEWDLSEYFEVKQYIVFPDVLTHPSAFYVTLFPDGTITTEEHKFEAFLMIIVYFVFCFITYMLWIKPKKYYNNALKKRRKERAS